MDNGTFLSPKGGYRQLAVYQIAEVIYDVTFHFTGRFLDYHDRTVDQMIQAARSGKQNIAEGSKASATSSETEIKLTNVARASLEELLLDYEDYLRVRRLTLWNAQHPRYNRLREYCKSDRLKQDYPELLPKLNDEEICNMAHHPHQPGHIPSTPPDGETAKRLLGKRWHPRANDPSPNNPPLQKPIAPLPLTIKDMSDRSDMSHPQQQKAPAEPGLI